MNGFVGAKYASDRSTYHVQTNNPTEAALKVYGKNSWLVSCGPTAMINCLAAIGYDTEIPFVGKYQPQPEEIVFDYLNDPRTTPELMAIRPLNLTELGIGAQEVPQYYPHAAAQLFGATGKFIERIRPDELFQCLTEGGAAQVSIHPGHYISIVAYIGTGDNQRFIFHDPWPQRIGGNGFAQEMTLQDWARLSRGWGVLYWPYTEGLF